ncbi:MAG: hypothetical protein UW44_C0008G0012 [Candidatus Collierbacteria bacterium GW2011_GWB2_44_22]|uniref:Uncharacterized protein n=1 Tax=Candidatus Collierbacteria bacterium GW2011_GWB2_44_22 TaxID=1618387 RepID=A0A0G1HXN0_9BACT|nr:MAG: hypothetical protein UW44_C0008G0012 [Candidatus Collierbacteria bacterium GW2011_GWB2_44_22]KKT66909.1 MAG: hypothetical protein UW58_C0001G0013 [Candidatus Collierbacteria bacterium GW2011_GWC2_44_30]
MNFPKIMGVIYIVSDGRPSIRDKNETHPKYLCLRNPCVPHRTAHGFAKHPTGDLGLQK